MEIPEKNYKGHKGRSEGERCSLPKPQAINPLRNTMIFPCNALKAMPRIGGIKGATGAMLQ